MVTQKAASRRSRWSSYKVGTPSVPSGFEPVFEQVEKQHPTDPIDIKDFAVESTLSVDKVLPESKFTYVLQITPTTEQQFKIDPENPWPQFTPILGDWWMINEQSITPLSNGGFQVKIEAESFQSLTTYGSHFNHKVETNGFDRSDQCCRTGSQGYTCSPNWSPLLDTSIATLNTGSRRSHRYFSLAHPKRASSELLLAFLVGWNIMPCVLLSLKLFGLIAGVTKRKQRAGLAYTGGSSLHLPGLQ